MGDLLRLTPHGLYCEAGDFYVDPRRAVERAVITHAHSDHARRGSASYLCADACKPLLESRLDDVYVESTPFGEPVDVNGVRVSFHPAGHILGSAQVRVEYGGEVWVVTGDYKTDVDPSCETFELVPCHTLITECTFGLPVYRWPDPEEVFGQINDWWRANQARGRASILFGYALGKAQRLLCGVDASIGPIYTDPSVEKMTKVYRHAGIAMPATTALQGDGPPVDWQQALIVAPSGATDRLRVIPEASTAFASGWMRLRKRRRQQSLDRGFVLSDHVDWPQLLDVVAASGAERVLTTHGYGETVARYLSATGMQAGVLSMGSAGKYESTGESESAGESEATAETETAGDDE